METPVNPFIQTGLFPCNRLIFQNHEIAWHGMDESQDISTDGAGNDREHQTFLSTTPVVGNL
jgi:hypothetical protein